MNCHDANAQLDDYLDGRLAAGGHEAIDGHLQRCPQCRRRYEQAAALPALLRTLPAPAPRPGFVEQALARAQRGTRPWRSAVRLALAASLALGVALGVFLKLRPADAPPVVHVALDAPQTVRLVLNSAQPLAGVTLHLTLPEHVELVGYAGRRELAWQTELRPGANLLRLPVVARGAGQGELVTRVSHAEGRKTFRVRIQTRPRGASRLRPAAALKT